MNGKKCSKPLSTLYMAVHLNAYFKYFSGLNCKFVRVFKYRLNKNIVILKIHLLQFTVVEKHYDASSD